MNKIPYPSEEKMNESIEFIVEFSLEKPDLMKEVFLMIRSIPLKLMFTNKLSFLFTLILYLLLTISLYYNKTFVSMDNFYMMVLMFSPTPFIIGLLDIVHIKECEMLPLEMSTRYNFQQVTAYKMVVLLVYTLIINSLMIVYSYIISGHAYHLAYSLMIMSSALFFTSSISLLILLRINNRYLPFVLVILWYGIVLFISYQFPWVFKEGIYFTVVMSFLIGFFMHYEQIKYLFSRKYIQVEG